MALRTVSNTGGNWSATTAWALGVVPVAGDTVAFTATSGNLTVDVSTANLAGINFSNYVGTITFLNNINTNGTVNLGTGGFTQAGASGLVINGNATLSGTTTWSRTLTFTGTSITYTLGSNLTITGAISLSGTTASTFTSNTLNIGGSLTVTTTATVSGTTAFVFNGTGTWSHTAAGIVRNNITINTAGTLTIGTNIYYNTGTLTYTAGTVTTTGSTLTIGSVSTTINTSTLNWNNVTIIVADNKALGITNTLTLTSDLNVNGTLTIGDVNDTDLTEINGAFTIYASGDLTISTSSTPIVAGTSPPTLVLDGTGTWSHTGWINGALRLDTTINTAGTITISGNIGYNTGTLTYTAGTVTTTGSTLNISGSTTLNTSILNWNNVSISSGTLTLNSTLNIGGTLTISASPTFTGTSGFSAGTLSLAGIPTATITLKNGITYTITNSFTCTSATSTGRKTIASDSGTIKTILTLNQGATQDIGFVNATRVDSSAGKTIYSYGATLTSTTNWNTLPVDPYTFSTRGDFSFLS